MSDYSPYISNASLEELQQQLKQNRLWGLQELKETAKLRIENKRLVDGIRELHHPAGMFDDYCRSCKEFWPCPTIQLIEGEKTINDESITDDSLLIEGEM